MKDMIPAWRNGKIVPVEKLEVHELGLKHKAVSIFLLNRGRVLIQQRAMGKYHTPGLWANTCCTHPDWDEPASDCAVRRLDEELGITGIYPSFRDRVEYRANVGGNLTEHEVVDIFVANTPDDLVIEPNPDEVMATRWVDLYELKVEVRRRPWEFTPWLRIYLSEHSETIFGEMAARV